MAGSERSQQLAVTPLEAAQGAQLLLDGVFLFPGCVQLAMQGLQAVRQRSQLAHSEDSGTGGHAQHERQHSIAAALPVHGRPPAIAPAVPAARWNCACSSN